jgi:DNA-binding NtrC family response regulator
MSSRSTTSTAVTRRPDVSLSQSPVPVVIEGEAGIGKEVLAEAIHETSPLMVFDCSAASLLHTPKDRVGGE